MSKVSNESTPRAATPISKKAERPPRPGLMRLTLAGLPELEQFKDDDQARQAIAEIEQESSRPRSLVFGIFFVAGAGGLAMFAARWVRGFVNWPAIIEEWLPAVAAVLTFALALLWAHRSGANKTLRQKLLDRGIPICLACGYSLRGAPPDSTRCTECGAAFDPRVAAILRPAVTTPPPGGKRPAPSDR